MIRTSSPVFLISNSWLNGVSLISSPHSTSGLSHSIRGEPGTCPESGSWFKPNALGGDDDASDAGLDDAIDDDIDIMFYLIYLYINWYHILHSNCWNT